jgi:hypothetical protein
LGMRSTNRLLFIGFIILILVKQSCAAQTNFFKPSEFRAGSVCSLGVIAGALNKLGPESIRIVPILITVDQPTIVPPS